MRAAQRNSACRKSRQKSGGIRIISGEAAVRTDDHRIDRPDAPRILVQFIEQWNDLRLKGNRYIPPAEPRIAQARHGRRQRVPPHGERDIHIVQSRRSQRGVLQNRR